MLELCNKNSVDNKWIALGTLITTVCVTKCGTLKYKIHSSYAHMCPYVFTFIVGVMLHGHSSEAVQLAAHKLVVTNKVKLGVARTRRTV